MKIINTCIILLLCFCLLDCKNNSRIIKSETIKHHLYDNVKKYYGIKNGIESYSALYACFTKDTHTLYEIHIRVNNDSYLYRFYDKTDEDEQLSLFNQIFSYISKKHSFDNVSRIMIFPRGIKTMTVELLENYEACGNYEQAIKNSHYFSKLFKLFNSYGINIKDIGVYDIYPLENEDKNDSLNNTLIDAQIFLETDRSSFFKEYMNEADKNNDSPVHRDLDKRKQ